MTMPSLPLPQQRIIRPGEQPFVPPTGVIQNNMPMAGPGPQVPAPPPPAPVSASPGSPGIRPVGQPQMGTAMAGHPMAAPMTRGAPMIHPTTPNFHPQMQQFRNAMQRRLGFHPQ